MSNKDVNLKCPSCNRIALKLVSVTDNGKGPRICQSCKRKMRAGIPIEKFKRSGVNFEQIEADMAKRAQEIAEGFH